MELLSSCAVCDKNPTHHLCSSIFNEKIFTCESEEEFVPSIRFCSAACVEIFSTGKEKIKKRVVVSSSVQEALLSENMEVVGVDVVELEMNEFGIPKSLIMMPRRSDAWCWKYIRDLQRPQQITRKGKLKEYNQICLLCTKELISKADYTTTDYPDLWKKGLLHVKIGTSNARSHVSSLHETVYEAEMKAELNMRLSNKRKSSEPGKTSMTVNPILQAFSRGKNEVAHMEECKWLVKDGLPHFTVQKAGYKSFAAFALGSQYRPTHRKKFNSTLDILFERHAESFGKQLDEEFKSCFNMPFISLVHDL